MEESANCERRAEWLSFFCAVAKKIRLKILPPAQNVKSAKILVVLTRHSLYNFYIGESSYRLEIPIPAESNRFSAV